MGSHVELKTGQAHGPTSVGHCATRAVTEVRMTGVGMTGVEMTGDEDNWSENHWMCDI